MRKDLFIVGAKLLGVWQLAGAVVAGVTLFASWANLIHVPSTSQEYNFLRLAVELVVGLYLIIKTESLYGLLSPAATEDKSEEPG